MTSARLHDPGATGRDERVVPWAVLAVALAVMGAAASVWRPLAPALPPVATDLDGFAPGVLAAIEVYRGPRTAVVVLASVVQVAVPLTAVLLPAGRRAVDRIGGRVGGPGGGRAWPTPLRAALVAAAVAVATSVATWPLVAWLRLVHDGRWGFRSQGPAGWLRDWLVVSSGRWLMVAAAAAVLVAVVARWPRSWPYRVTVAGPMVAAVVVLLHPVLLQPLLLSSEPLPAGPHRDAVTDVLDRADAAEVPVRVGDQSRRSTRVNAFVTGLGPTERIVLHDTLLELPPEQVASVVAHELAHVQHRDVARGVALAATALLPGTLLLRSVLRRMRVLAPDARATAPRVAAVAVAVLVVLELVTQPVAGLVSRRYEAAADARAVELTGDAGTLIAATRVFTVRDLADPEPSTGRTVVYATHPSVGERIRQAVAIAARDRLDLPTRVALEADEAGQRHAATTAEGPR